MKRACSEKPVVFNSSGVRLFGVVGTPTTPEPRRRGVVLIHGWGGYRIGPRRILVHAARRLAEAGFFTLRFDLRGRGDSAGEGRKTCLDDMIEDTLHAVDFLSGATEAQRITLLGICSGANVAIGAATLRTDSLRELALWSTLPFQPQQRSRQRVRRARFYLGKYLRKALNPATWRKMLRGDVDYRMVGRAIAGDRRPGSGEVNLKDSARDIMSEFGRFNGRALFVTGTEDPEGQEGRRLFARFCESRRLEAVFHPIAGATHSFYAPAHEREVIETTLAWLKQ